MHTTDQPKCPWTDIPEGNDKDGKLVRQLPGLSVRARLACDGGVQNERARTHAMWITKYRYKEERGEVAERTRDLIWQICAARR